ncbi:MAG: glycosyltransferase [Planctomyces sp.]|nr:glycosyltransferase [Planctomyces sp.]
MNPASAIARPAPELARSASAAARPLRVLSISGAFPSSIRPVHGVFVKERLRFVSQLPGVSVRVISPIPYFPPIRAFKRWYPWSQMSRFERIDGLDVHRPRYVLPPKIGGYISPRLMYRGVRRIAERLREVADFDVIDAHFVYPSGIVAVMLGEALGKPVVITCRGEDIERFPRLPIVGDQIRRALRSANQLIGVSRPIADEIVRQGGAPERVTCIPNGVDCERFRPTSQASARERLGLPQGRRIILAVGYRLELKGFHILVDALPRIREAFPDALVAIVGGEASWAADFLPVIESRIQANNVGEHVLIAGNRPQDELADWYSAADVLAILSSREGSPNVLMEALACGLPAVATSVGGIPDVLQDARLGQLLPERSADAAAAGLCAALGRNWDRDGIREVMEQQSWQVTARNVDEVLRRAAEEGGLAPASRLGVARTESMSRKSD